MLDSRKEIVQKLLDSYRTYYNITLYDEQLPLRARCEYYEHNEKYVVSRKANLWQADSEEFIYLYDVPVLTVELVEKYIAEAREAGMELAHIGKGHMATYITAVFVCDSCEPEAGKLLKKRSIHKAFRFYLHGWMEVRLAAIDIAAQSLTTNRAGRCMEKNLKKIIFS